MAGWVEVHLETEVLAEGEVDPLRLQLLRPAAWLQAHPAQVGERLAIHLEEFKLQGEALVTYVGKAPRLKAGSRCPVTGRLQHMSRDVIALTFEGDARSLRLTRKHPVYSAEREGWVDAAQVQPGERLSTRDGSVSVRAVLLEAQPRSAVYDLEVAGVHSYFVHEQKVLAHNCPQAARVGGSLDDLANAGKAMDRGGLTRAGRALEKHGGRQGSVFPKATGNVADKNRQGQEILEDILTTPGMKSSSNKFGGQDFFDPSGRGARFNQDGSFRGFLEPPTP
jgi:hypothetical protein